MSWSEWITVSGSGWRLPIAIPRAEVTSTGVADWLMDQPTTRRLKGVEDHCAVDLAFSGWMLGRIRHPQLVRFVADEAAVYQVRWGIQGSDPTPSGASALLRPCRPVLRMSIPRRVVPDPDSIRQRQLRVHPRCFIRRRDCWWIWWMRSASHTWRIARAEAGGFSTRRTLTLTPREHGTPPGSVAPRPSSSWIASYRPLRTPPGLSAAR